MATHQEVEETLLEARLALLDRIKHEAETGKVDKALEAAEAYAWITVPNNAH